MVGKSVNAKVLYKRHRKIRLDRISVTILVILCIILIIDKKRNERKEKENIVFVRNAMCDDVSEVGHLSEDLGEYVWGIDISRWQTGCINQEWMHEAKRRGCKFVYIQFAKTNPDNKSDDCVLTYFQEAEAFAKMAEEAELDFGFYFLTDVKEEPNRIRELGIIVNFLNDVKKKFNFKMNTLPLMLDHEVYGDEEALEDSNARCQMLERQILELNSASIYPIVYTSGSKLPELQEYLGEEQIFWVADSRFHERGVPPKGFPEQYDTENVVMWQYTADDALIEERGISISQIDSPPGSTIVQLGLDRNLMKKEFFLKYSATT